jgi:hypothetical protein
MKKEKLGTLYDRFTGEERFKLLIAALARGDEKEAKSLVGSCPRETYRIHELTFTAPYKASMIITIGLCLDLAPLLTSMRMVEALREILPLTSNLCEYEATLAYLDGHKAGSRLVWKAVGKTGNPPGGQDGDEEGETPAMEEDLQRITDRLEEVRESFIGSLQELKRHTASEALTTWQAFAEFCEEDLLVEPETLVQVWFEPMLPEIETLKNFSDPPEVDPEELEVGKAALKRCWSELVRKS